MRKIFSTLFEIYTKVTALVFIAEATISYITDGTSCTFDFGDLTGVFFIGIVSAVFYLPFIIFEKIPKGLYIILNIFYYIFINFIVLATGFHQNWLQKENTKSIILLESSIIIIYVIMMLVTYRIDSKNVDKINSILKSRSETEK